MTIRQRTEEKKIWGAAYLDGSGGHGELVRYPGTQTRIGLGGVVAVDTFEDSQLGRSSPLAVLDLVGAVGIESVVFALGRVHLVFVVVVVRDKECRGCVVVMVGVVKGVGQIAISARRSVGGHNNLFHLMQKRGKQTQVS